MSSAPAISAAIFATPPIPDLARYSFVSRLSCFQFEEKDRTKERRTRKEARVQDLGLAGLQRWPHLSQERCSSPSLFLSGLREPSRRGRPTRFCTVSQGPMEAQPFASLIQDTAGNLYGTTLSGGTYNNGVVSNEP